MHLALLSFSSLALGALFPDGGAVKTLTAANFDSIIGSGPSVAYLAMTATWCGHCKNLSPELLKAAEQLEPLVPVYNVDCDTDKEICTRFDVKSYPTLKIYTRGTKIAPRDYTGERVASAMAEYALESIKNVVKRFQSKGELDTWIDGRADRSRVLLLSPKPLTPAFYKVIALDLAPNVELGVIRLSAKNEEVRQRYNVVGQDPVIVQVSTKETYTGPMEYEEAKKWIKSVTKSTKDEL